MIACRFCGDAAKATVITTGMETYTANLNTWRRARRACE
jgi:hypothetical protein